MKSSLLVRCWAGLAAAAAVPGALADAPADKTHTLFMGADVAVGLDHVMYPVSDVEGSAWIVQKKGDLVSIPTRTDALEIRITPSLKLTERSVTVAGLHVDRGYTFANDPTTRQVRALNDSATANSGFAAALNQANARADASTAQSEMGVNRAGGVLSSSSAPGRGFSPVGQFAPPPSQASLEEGYTRSSAGADNETTGERNSEGFDAMNIDFAVSSDRLLQNPYVVTMVRFHPHGAKDGVVQNLIYAKALDPIDAQPLHVHLNEGGFPLGFTPVGFQLHLYNHGQEIATSVSDDRVTLTRDEAFEYLRSSYLGSHAHDTLPAVAAMGHISADLPARLGQGQYAAPIYVRVSKEGLPDSIYRDQACTQPLADPYVDALVRGLRFEPALERGAPVAGIATLQLRQLLGLY